MEPPTCKPVSPCCQTTVVSVFRQDRPRGMMGRSKVNSFICTAPPVCAETYLQGPRTSGGAAPCHYSTQFPNCPCPLPYPVGLAIQPTSISTLHLHMYVKQETPHFFYLFFWPFFSPAIFYIEKLSAFRKKARVNIDGIVRRDHVHVAASN